MRWGLVLLGLALCALAALLVLLGLFSYPQSVETRNTTNYTLTIPPGTTGNLTILGANGFSGITLSYTTSLPTYVWLTTCPPTGSIPPPCVAYNNQTGSLSGSYSSSHSSWPYYLVLRNVGRSTSSLSLTVVLTEHTENGLPMWEVITVFASAGVLAAGGSLAAFLGFFLRGDPYQSPAPVVTDTGPEGEDSESPETVSRP